MAATKIGCDHAMYAILTEAVDGTPTWGTPVALPGLLSVGINPNGSVDTLFYDDGPGDTAATLGKIEMEVEKNYLTTTEKAALLGHVLDSNKALVSGGSDTPPWVAFGFRSLKSDGTYRYVWLYKGKFIDPEDQNKTKGDSVNFNTDTIKGNFVKLDKEYTVGTKVTKPYKIEIDEADTGVPANLIPTWFNKVVEPNATVTT